VVPKVLHNAFNGIFNARFLKNKKKLSKIKNVKKLLKKRGKNKKRKKSFFTSMEETLRAVARTVHFE